jgi:FMN phosphatase YigB (HAD superfamily)
VFGIDATATVFIDDMAYNAEAARRHGWQAVHFESPEQCERALASLGVP